MPPPPPPPQLQLAVSPPGPLSTAPPPPPPPTTTTLTEVTPAGTTKVPEAVSVIEPLGATAEHAPATQLCPAAHAVVQLPQVAVAVSASSQPSAAVALQSP